MTDHEIPTLERTTDGRRSMRSVADALEALRNAGHCRAGSLLEIRTSSLPAKTADAPSIVLVVCRATPSEEAWGVALATSYEFTARSLGKDTAMRVCCPRLPYARCGCRRYRGLVRTHIMMLG
jgi:hypothetical protein